MNVENLKVTKNILKPIIVECITHSRIEHFFKNIAKNLQPGLHFGHLNKDGFSTKKWCSIMCNNFVTDQCHRTKLTG